MGVQDEGGEQAFRLPERSSRGKRMTQLLNEQVEADDAFWNQDALKEEEEDVEFEEGDAPAQEDIFDSDFDEDEPEEAEEKGEETEKRRKRKKPLGYGIGKRSTPSAKKQKQGRAKKKGEDRKQDGGTAKESHAGEGKIREEEGEREGEEEDGGGEEGDEEDKSERGGYKAVAGFEVWQERRKSSRASVVEKALEREILQQEASKTKRVVKRRKQEEERRLTQEDMLLEAAQTEIANTGYLEYMLAREEEVKRKAVVEKAKFGGPQVKFRSKDGRNVMEFTNVSELPALLKSEAVKYPEQPICVVTGRPARYKDPFTGLPYADAEAFKVLRERFSTRRKRVPGKH